MTTSGGELAGRLALVCAASRGLGKAAATALAAEGARVAICARDRLALERAAEEITRASGSSAVAIPADVSRPDEVRRVVREAAERLGGLDVLVTNAGGPPAGTFDAITEEDWRRAVDLLLMSVVLLCQEALPHLRRRGRGRIINITSVSVKQPVEALMLSNALRPAVVGLSKTLAAEVAREGITVNCVAPGYTRTERVVELTEATARREGVEPDEVAARLVRQIPAGRLGEPEELAALIGFLASDRAAYITGTTIQVDGGYVKSLL